MGHARRGSLRRMPSSTRRAKKFASSHQHQFAGKRVFSLCLEQFQSMGGSGSNWRSLSMWARKSDHSILLIIFRPSSEVKRDRKRERLLLGTRTDTPHRSPGHSRRRRIASKWPRVRREWEMCPGAWLLTRYSYFELYILQFLLCDGLWRERRSLDEKEPNTVIYQEHQRHEHFRGHENSHNWRNSKNPVFPAFMRHIPLRRKYLSIRIC